MSEDDAARGADAPQERDPWAPPAEDAVPPPSLEKRGAWPPPGPVSVQPPGDPFAPPPGAGQGEPVPPPPVSPDGPGQAPYGYPGHAYAGSPGYPGYDGYQAPPGYEGHGHPGHPGPHGPGPQGWPGYPGHAGYPVQGPPGYGWPAMPMAPANGMGVAALVLGIVAAVGFCLWPLAIVLGILAVIFGSIGRRKARRGEATNGGQALAGIICGAAGIVLGVAMVVFLLVVPDEDDDTGSSDDPGFSATLVVNAPR
ncbi:DUF4190 domain-containing protein [Streptomyces formicae]